MDRRDARVGEFLAKDGVFGPLGAPLLRELAETAIVRRLKAGETLWAMASCPREMAVVLEGRLDVERDGARGPRILRRLDPGSVVGFSLVAGEPSTARLAAGIETDVALLPARPLRSLLARHPDLALRIIGELGALVGRLTDELLELRTALPGRVATWLLKESRHGLAPIEVTHARLAAQLGAERASVSRELEHLEREGLVALEKGRIRVLRAADLRARGAGSRGDAEGGSEGDR